MIGIDGFSSQEERSPQGQEFVTAEDADAYDPFTIVAGLSNEQLPHIYLDCGTEDRLISGARELAGILMERDIPFDYMQMGGAHNAAYWIQAIGRIMGVQYEVMQRALGQRPSGQRTAIRIRTRPVPTPGVTGPVTPGAASHRVGATLVVALSRGRWLPGGGRPRGAPLRTGRGIVVARRRGVW